MTDPEDSEALAQQALRLTRTVSISMFVGLAFLYAIVLSALVSTPADRWQGAQWPVPLPLLGLVLALLGVGMSFVIKKKLLGQAPANAEEKPQSLGPLLGRFRSATLAAIGICEGSAFLLGLFVLAAGPAYTAWLIAGLLPLAGMVLHFPTHEALDRFLGEAQRED